MLLYTVLAAHIILSAFTVFVTPTFIGPVVRTTSEDLSRAVKACELLKDNFPELVSFPGSENFINDIEHWAFSSEANSTCSFEPRTAEDVSAAIKIIGRPDIRSPFAVKSVGHAYNPGHSSTFGVQISMARFTNVSHDVQKGTVSTGVGLSWDQLYEQLVPLGVMVAGGRIPGVGVGGLSLGGGYSWKTNQFGLTIDTIVAHELVLPSGEIVHVTNQTEPDLFFALKGGLNNFGIVTGITLMAHNQTDVFGGVISYSNESIGSFNEALADFSQNNTDVKAQGLFTYATDGTAPVTQAILVYDAPTVPSGIFDKFLSIPSLSSDIRTRNFSDFMASIGTLDPGIGPFGFAGGMIPTAKYTVPILEEIATQTQAFASRLAQENNGTAIRLALVAEPFVHPYAHSLGGAYPHPPNHEVPPTSVNLQYAEGADTPLSDRAARHAAFVAEAQKIADVIQAKAVQEGLSQFGDIIYSNYALPNTSLELMYGENVPRLKELAARFDPDKIMTLTGGFHFQE
ncbi:FAD-binding domain-containing protein [Fomitiporia mediterranea MF3/22]|uniref:FAD-binding domain-containing protein n=1 Tax=Fomitiporia mediterranea (strain MF3/22) TaxID=694068 RepID=UPI0004409C12|nr:FAD-binding domain-containing protein [Fomitiporia mediterranea MF3/22]EJD05535.1 FAD-binding domain-containing protein [Fomitiporia mediterranea MF3/22]